jgi:hypothetical protein
MTRILAATVLLCFVGVAPAFADERPVDFSPKAAGLVTDGPSLLEAARAPIRQPRPIVAAEARSSTPKQAPRTSFWRTPWPYVIAGAVVVGLVIANKNSEGGIY